MSPLQYRKGEVYSKGWRAGAGDLYISFDETFVEEFVEHGLPVHSAMRINTNEVVCLLDVLDRLNHRGTFAYFQYVVSVLERLVLDRDKYEECKRVLCDSSISYYAL